MWRFSLDAPAIVSHHIYIPSHLILFLYRLYILVESFTFLVTDVIKVFREVMEMTICKIQLNAHVATKRFVAPSFWTFFVSFSVREFPRKFLTSLFLIIKHYFRVLT